MLETKLEYVQKQTSSFKEEIKNLEEQLKGNNQEQIIKQVQEEICKLKMKKKAVNNEIRYKNYLHDPRNGQKKLYRRMSDKEILSVIPELKGDSDHSNENRMAMKWSELMGIKTGNRNSRRWQKKIFNHFKWKTLSKKGYQILESKISELEISI